MFKLMGTRWQSTAGCHKKHKKQKVRENDMEEDRISRLPDEVLLSILSHLTIKEAAMTSFLARRWRKVWTSIPSLNFDASQFLFLRKGLSLNVERRTYLQLVNCVLDAYQGCTIDEFKVEFDFDIKYNSIVDRWLNFASEKRVKRLVMGFWCTRGPKLSLPLLCSPVPLTAKFPDFRSLTDIQLSAVNISGGVIEHFLSTCPYLENICIFGSGSLVDLNVSGQSLYLKCLKIHCCDAMKSIYLSATNLSTFKYLGPKIEISFANVPNLVNVALEGGYFIDNPSNIYQLSTNVYQLDTLTLSGIPAKESMALLEFPVFAHLKNLKLNVSASDYESLLVFAPLIKAAPSLHRLLLNLRSYDTEYFRQRRFEKGVECPHQCLKVVEIIGFLGQVMDMEFAMFLIENAVTLEKFIVSPPTYKLDSPSKKYVKRTKQVGRNGAMLLQSKFSLGEKLVLRNFSV